ncbi:MAG: hypothetical protein ACE37F_01640 [Nannocystaceae bacterium]|nr:hypothetical protein [bacterium]
MVAKAPASIYGEDEVTMMIAFTKPIVDARLYARPMVLVNAAHRL